MTHHVYGELRQLARFRAGRWVLGLWLGLTTVVVVGVVWMMSVAGSGALLVDAAAAMYAHRGWWVDMVLLVLVGLAIAWLVGPRALTGFVGAIATIVVVLAIALPTARSGVPPAVVGLVAGAVCALLALGLTYGTRAVGFAAALATLASLIVATGVTSALFAVVDEHGGMAEATTIIAVSGGMADIAVAQASAATQLKRAAPDIATREFLRHTLVQGREHLTSMIHTYGPALSFELVAALPAVGGPPDGASLSLAFERLLIATLGFALVTRLTSGLTVRLLGSLPTDVFRD